MIAAKLVDTKKKPPPKKKFKKKPKKTLQTPTEKCAGGLDTSFNVLFCFQTAEFLLAVVETQ